MEKLIELLNKFEREMFPEEHEYIKFPDGTDDDGGCWYYEEDPTFGEQEGFNYTSRGDKRNSELNQLLIISKEFGFIKWLIENEKIEENSDLITLASELGCAFSSDVLLMYLAIQDEPIKFLLEILK